MTGRHAWVSVAVVRRLAGLALCVAASGLGGAPLAAQDDVVELGRVYGTRPPEAYLKYRQEHPEAFEFGRALWRRNPRLSVDRDRAGERRVRPAARSGVDAAGVAGGSVARVIGPGVRAVEGDFAFPLVLGYFADDAGPPPFTAVEVQREFFDGPNSRYQTIPEFYTEMSRGRVTLIGETLGWAQAGLTRLETTAGTSGLAGSRVGDFIHSVLTELDDGSVDWGRFDNDGPDGLPNSGDDDGFVDVLAVFHPTWGAECGGSGREDRVWSHRWSLSSAGAASGSADRSYETRSAAAGGGMIQIDDYTIQPVYSCDQQSINEIGVFAHELGHGFGLPDLYCTSSGCSSGGVGLWDLMGLGSWGCSVRDAARPCHMGAWSKMALGWVEVETLPPGVVTPLSLPSVQSSGRVVRIDALDGSGEYLLLENRQREGSQEALTGSGLLIWHIDELWLQQTWPSNRVNATPSREGVRVQQADGRNHLRAGVNRADAGDPYPGASRNAAFHAGTTPAARSNTLGTLGITLTDINEVDGVISLDALARFQTLTVRVEGTQREGLVKVNREAVALGDTLELRSAPFESHLFTAEPGDSLAPGLRRPFAGWGDGGSNALVRTVITGFEDTDFVARYAGEQARVSSVVAGAALGVAPGSITASPASPDGWFALGQTVSFTAVPRAGFAFSSWSGDVGGSQNPVQLSVSAPATVSAGFSLGFGGLVQPFVANTVIDATLADALDAAGNDNGVYDVGDLRSWLRSASAGTASDAVLEAMRAAGGAR